MESLTKRCTRCGQGRLRPWQELTEEEREVTLRLPMSADYSTEVRRLHHRWCTRCWFEATRAEDMA